MMWGGMTEEKDKEGGLKNPPSKCYFPLKLSRFNCKIQTNNFKVLENSPITKKFPQSRANACKIFFCCNSNRLLMNCVIRVEVGG